MLEYVLDSYAVLAYLNREEGADLAAAHVKANHRVSYADAFVIALAQESKATVVTGDPEFRSVDKKVDILWLREPTPKREISDRKTARERRAAYRGKPKRKG